MMGACILQSIRDLEVFGVKKDPTLWLTQFFYSAIVRLTIFQSYSLTPGATTTITFTEPKVVTALRFYPESSSNDACIRVQIKGCLEGT